MKKIKAEGRWEANAEWEAWLKRRDAALAKGLPFDEPNPSHAQQLRQTKPAPLFSRWPVKFLRYGRRKADGGASAPIESDNE